MPIHLITGLPGSGKSLGSVEMMLAFKQAEPDRPVYVHGVDGLKPSVAEVIDADQVRRWKELPVGSIIVVDEAQKLLPARRQGEPAQWIRDLSEYRHHGIDLVLATQHPSLLDNYVRTLVDRHTHHVRKFGGSSVDRYEWSYCCGSPLSKTERRAALRSKWRFPKKLFDLYKSAELHTIKKRVPWKVYAMWGMFAAVAFGAVGAAWVLVHRTRNAGQVVAGSAVVSSVPGRKGDTGGGVHYASPEEYAAAFIPRVVNQPWSAPAYDGDAIRSRPDLMCIEFHARQNGAKVCQCYTEQATRYHVPPAECFRTAREGTYNPHRPPLDDEGRRGGQDGRQRDGGPRGPSEGVAGVSPAGGARVGAAYDPSVFGPHPHMVSVGRPSSR